MLSRCLWPNASDKKGRVSWKWGIKPAARVKEEAYLGQISLDALIVKNAQSIVKSLPSPARGGLMHPRFPENTSRTDRPIVTKLGIPNH